MDTGEQRPSPRTVNVEKASIIAMLASSIGQKLRPLPAANLMGSSDGQGRLRKSPQAYSSFC